jgi:hypothetical protein
MFFLNLSTGPKKLNLFPALGVVAVILYAYCYTILIGDGFRAVVYTV